MPAVADLASRLNDLAIDDTQTPDERVAGLRRLREQILAERDELDPDDPGRADLTALAGHADTYIGANELQREGTAMEAELDVARVREDAEVRDRLVADGTATAAELDAAGWPSHDDLDAAATDGTLAESLAHWTQPRVAAPEAEPEDAPSAEITDTEETP